MKALFASLLAALLAIAALSAQAQAPLTSDSALAAGGPSTTIASDEETDKDKEKDKDSGKKGG